MATTYEEVLTLFREVAEAQKETERKFQETDRLLREQSQETDRKFQETDRKIKTVTATVGDLGNRLGEFVEGLVRPAVVRLFRERGIEVHEVYPDVEVDRHDEGLEIDLLVVNDTEAVGVKEVVASAMRRCLSCRPPEPTVFPG